MASPSPLLPTQRVVQVCLFLFAAIALSGGLRQIWLGLPGGPPRLDNNHRFLAGVLFGLGVICLWAALTIRTQGALVHAISATSVAAGIGRIVSMAQVGTPDPKLEFYSALAVELIVPVVMSLSQRATQARLDGA